MVPIAIFASSLVALWVWPRNWQHTEQDPKGARSCQDMTQLISGSNDCDMKKHHGTFFFFVAVIAKCGDTLSPPVPNRRQWSHHYGNERSTVEDLKTRLIWTNIGLELLMPARTWSISYSARVTLTPSASLPHWRHRNLCVCMCDRTLRQDRSK